MMGLVRAGLLRITIGQHGPARPGGRRQKSHRTPLRSPNSRTFSQSVAEQRECQIEKGRTPKERKYRFNQQLRETGYPGRSSIPRNIGRT